MEAAAREKALAAENSKLKDVVKHSKEVWGAETADDIELDKVRHPIPSPQQR